MSCFFWPSVQVCTRNHTSVMPHIHKHNTQEDKRRLTYSIIRAFRALKCTWKTGFILPNSIFKSTSMRPFMVTILYQLIVFNGFSVKPLWEHIFFDYYYILWFYLFTISRSLLLLDLGNRFWFSFGSSQNKSRLFKCSVLFIYLPINSKVISYIYSLNQTKHTIMHSLVVLRCIMRNNRIVLHLYYQVFLCRFSVQTWMSVCCFQN